MINTCAKHQGNRGVRVSHVCQSYSLKSDSREITKVFSVFICAETIRADLDLRCQGRELARK